MKAAVKDLVNKIQETRIELARQEEMLDYYEAMGIEHETGGCKESVESLRKDLEELMNQHNSWKGIKGSLPQEISIDGRHMFLDSEEAENGFAFFYQAADSFSPDIYVCNENQQLAGKDMEYELKSRGIEW